MREGGGGDLTSDGGGLTGHSGASDGGGGGAAVGYACLDQVPRVLADDPSGKTSFAFAATPGIDPRGTCGTCFELRFTGQSGTATADAPPDVGAAQLAAAGKRLIVQVLFIACRRDTP